MTSGRSGEVIYEVDRVPVFQNRTYATADEARNCPVGNVRLEEDPLTGLVQNILFDATLPKYDEFYQNEQGLSPLFRRHLEKVAGIVSRNLGRRSIIEVGCGKGLFLEMLQAEGIDIAGFDPTYEGSNPRVFKRYFEPGVLPAEGLILRHVLEHIQDPVSFLGGLKPPARSAKIYIEVPCFEWICARRAWFDIFYEHVNYFRLSDFYRMFGKVYESGRSFGGQYLWVVADLASLRRPERDPGDPVDHPRDFLGSLPSGLDYQTRPAAVWGGASKGVIFALLRERVGRPVDLVIDINPAKQHRYLPGTGLRVHSPEEALAILPAGAPVFVMNSNYLDEIRQMSGDVYAYVPIDRD